MDRDLARRTAIEISFDGIDITDSLKNYFLSLSYTDTEDGESDDLEFTVQDRDSLWLQSWLASAIDAAASTGKSSPSSAPSLYTVTPKIGLNVRSGPGTSYKKISALACGAQIEVSSINDGWAQIQYNDSTAYVSANYITAVSQSHAVSVSTGLSVRAAIVRQNWSGDGTEQRLDCGSFELDSVDADGPPDTITFRAAALPFSSAIRETEKSQSWEEYHLSGIAREIAKRHSMECLFQCDYDPHYKRREQSRESDITFLKRLCKDAGISIKITDHMIVLFDSAAFEQQDPVITIRRGDGSYTSRKLHVGSASTQYQSCRVRYVNPKTGQTIEAVEKIPDYDPDSDNNRQLEISAAVENATEARILAKKRLRMANRYAKTAAFDLSGNPSLLAGLTVSLQNWGPWNGKYIITQAVHSVGGGGYTTHIELRRCLNGY